LCSYAARQQPSWGFILNLRNNHSINRQCACKPLSHDKAFRLASSCAIASNWYAALFTLCRCVHLSTSAPASTQLSPLFVPGDVGRSYCTTAPGCAVHCAQCRRLEAGAKAVSAGGMRMSKVCPMTVFRSFESYNKPGFFTCCVIWHALVRSILFKHQ
jgi:hypothetical protein